MQAEITRKDEQKYLRFKISENPIFAEELTFAQIIANIENGRLSLEVSEDDGTKILDDSSIEEIKRVVLNSEITNKTSKKSMSLQPENPCGIREVVCPTFWDRPLFSTQKLRHQSKKSDFENSETKYFTNLLTNP